MSAVNMGTVPASPSRVSPPATDAREFRHIPLTELFESSSNPRKLFEAETLDELAASICQHGVRSPLEVRVRAAGGFEIISGARRYRAAKIAALETVPCLVSTQVDDGTTLELQLLENLQRQDVDALSEAAGYAQLLEMPGYNADRIAERLSKDRSHVYKRLQLAKASTEAQKAYQEGRIAIGHLLIIARLSKAADQKHAFKKCFRTVWESGAGQVEVLLPAEEFDAFVKRELLLDLSAAPWKKDDAELVPAAGACKDCTRRSGANPFLFSDKGKQDLCLDSACYKRKADAFVQLAVAKASTEEKPAVAVSTEWNVGAKKDAPLTVNQYKEVQPKASCPHAEAAVITQSDTRRGETIQICRHKGCKVHDPQSKRAASSPARSESLKDVWDRKRAELNKGIEDLARTECVKAMLSGSLKPKARQDEALRLLAIEVFHLLEDGGDGIFAALGIEEPKEKELEKFVSDYVKRGTAVQLLLVAVMSHRWIHPPALNSALAVFGVNQADVKKKVAAPLLKKFEAERAEAFAKQKPATKKAAAKGAKNAK